jgi:hypothetical protein
MKPRTLAVLDAAMDFPLAVAVGLALGLAGAFLAAIPAPAPSPAVSTRASAFRGAGWGEAAGDSSRPAPAPENARMEIDQTLLDALAAVETNGNDAAINFAEDAHGRYQIRAGYLADGNAALGTRYTLAEMHDPDKAARIVCAYLTRYGSAWERRTGLTATDEVLARLHNGGPRGPDKAATRGYAAKVLARILEGGAR